MCDFVKLVFLFMLISACSCASNEKILSSLNKKYSISDIDKNKKYWGTLDGERVSDSEAFFAACLNGLERVSNKFLMERDLLDCMKGQGLFFIDESVIVVDH